MADISKKEEKIVNQFQNISKQAKPKPKYFKNIVLAFIVGGIICTIGQFILNMLIKYGIPEDAAKKWLPIIMVFLGAFNPVPTAVPPSANSRSGFKLKRIISTSRSRLERQPEIS